MVTFKDRVGHLTSFRFLSLLNIVVSRHVVYKLSDLIITSKKYDLGTKHLSELKCYIVKRDL